MMELSASVSRVLSGKKDNMVAIFVPHFCVSQVAKEIIRSVDSCMASYIRGKPDDIGGGDGDGTAAAAAPPSGIRKQHHRVYTQGECDTRVPTNKARHHQQHQHHHQHHHHHHHNKGSVASFPRHHLAPGSHKF